MRPAFPPPTHAASTPVGFLPSHYTSTHSGPDHGPPSHLFPYPNDFYRACGQVSTSSRPPQAHHTTTASSSYRSQSRSLHVSRAPFDHGVDVYSDSARSSASPRHRVEMHPLPTSFHAPSRTAVARSYGYDRAVSKGRQATSGAWDAVDRMVAERLSEKDAHSDGPVRVSRSLLSRLIGCDDVTEITKVILSSPSKGLKMRNICKELEFRYASLRGRSDWRVRVRYLLSQKNRFVRDDDVDEYEDNDEDGETMGGIWRVDLSLKGNRLRHGVIKSPVVQTKLAATAKSSQKPGMEKLARPRNSTDVKRKKALQSKHERESPAQPRAPPARPHRWYLDPPAKDNPYMRLPPVSTLLNLHPL